MANAAPQNVRANDSPVPIARTRYSAKRLLLDWHIPDFGRPVRIDVADYLAAMDRMRPDAIYLMSKSAFGCTYYDDAFGYHNRALAQDLLADLVRPLRKRGVEVFAYFNTTLNDVVARERPEWHQVQRDGKPAVTFTYHQLCMNSEYRDRVFGMLADIAGKYEVDGFWLDLTYMLPDGCFCAACRRQFEAEAGFPLTPEIGADPVRNARFHQFRRETRQRFIEDAVRRAAALRPGLRFGWNHAGDLLFGEVEADQGAAFSSVEFHPPLFLRGGITARHLSTLGKPFELMLPESLGSWGDWTVMSKPTMRAMAGIAAAHGGAIIVGHVPYPSGDLAGQMAEGVVETIADSFKLLDERRPFCEGARSVPVAACLHSVEAWRAVQAADGLNQRPHFHTGVRGGMDLLAESNIHFDVLTERQLDGLARYELLVMSETEYVSPATAQALREYVRGGGTLVAMGRVSCADAFGRRIPNFELADLLGADLVEESPYSVAYLDRLDPRLTDGLPRMPLLMKAATIHEMAAREKSLRCRAREGSEVWATFTDPPIEPDLAAYRHIYHLHAPPSERTDWPAILHRRFGAGRVVYIAGPFGYAFNYTSSPWLRRLFMNLLGALERPQRLRVEGPPGIEVSLMEQDGAWRLHLIPRGTESHASLQIAEALYVHGIRVSVRKPGLKRVSINSGGEPIRFTSHGPAAVFELPPIREWTIVTLE